MGSDTESGAIETSAKAAPKPIRVTWHPMLHFDDDASIDWAAVAANGGLPFAVGAGVGQSFSLSVTSSSTTKTDAPHSHPCAVRSDRKKHNATQTCRTSWRFARLRPDAHCAGRIG